MASDEYVISFPHMGDYEVIFKGLAGITGCKVMPPPKMTRRTLELGSLHSPDSVCVPFKYNLGNYLEAIEKGANTIFTAAGGCRFDYYFECHSQILGDLGHDVWFIQTSIDTLFQNLKKMNPTLTRWQFWYAFTLQVKKLGLMDEVQDRIRKKIGFQEKPGTLEKIWKRFLKDLDDASSFLALRRLGKRIRSEVAAVPENRPERPLKVGIVGELYLLMEPFSNFNLEKRLGEMGVEVHRWVTLTSILHHGLASTTFPRELKQMADPYVRYHLGAHGTESVARLQWMIRNGFDGAIHLKPFACMPEINAMPAMYRMCRDHRFPLTCFSFDSHTSDAFVKTRLEAFYDMILFKRQGVSV